MKVLDRLEWGTKCLAGLCLASVFLLVVTQVVCRYIFSYSLPSASELSIYAMIWAVFLGAAAAFRDGQHIAMSVLKDRAPQNYRRVLEVIIFLGLVLFLCVVIKEGYGLSLRAMRQVSPAAGLPVGYISFAMPICSLLALVFLTENFLQRLKRGFVD